MTTHTFAAKLRSQHVRIRTTSKGGFHQCHTNRHLANGQLTLSTN